MVGFCFFFCWFKSTILLPFNEALTVNQYGDITADNFGSLYCFGHWITTRHHFGITFRALSL
jgi:hypothetical protein